MKAYIKKRVLYSALVLVSIYIGIFLMAIASGGNGIGFFLDLLMAYFSVFLVITTVFIIIAGLFGSFNINIAIPVCTSSLINFLLLLCIYSNGVSNVYYDVLFMNLFVAITLIIILIFAVKRHNKMK
jgi:hypothetical protein